MGVVVRYGEVKNFTVLWLTLNLLACDFQECFLVILLCEEEARGGWSGENAPVPAGIGFW